MAEAMAESGRILMDSLSLNDVGAESEAASSGAQRRMTKRQISAGAYVDNTPGALYDNKFQRVNFLGARKPGVVPKMWSAEEDENLREAVQRHGEKNWREIAKDIPGRNHLQCLQRWKKALKPGLIKGHWSKEEDSTLLSMIQSYQAKGSINNINWAAIAQQIEGRNAKQCRERWYLNLDPAINRGPWTPEEDRRLLELAAQCGGRWSLIAKNMEGRTENLVKTRYHSLQRQEARNRGWTSEEDSSLINATVVFGRDWSKIVKQLPGRSRGQLKKRFAVLTQHKPDIVRKVQQIEEQLAKGILQAPNPPPPPIQPIGAQVLKENLIAQKQGQRPTRAPVTSPFITPTVDFTRGGGDRDFGPDIPPPSQGWGATPPYYPQAQPPPAPAPANPSTSQQQFQQQYPQQQQHGAEAPKKGMYRKYGSSWMAGVVDNLDGNGSTSALGTYGTDMGVGLRRTNSQTVLHDFLRTDGNEVMSYPQGGAAPYQQPKKGLQRAETSNLAMLDKLLGESTMPPPGDDFLASPPIEGPPTKGLRQYNSWGSLGGGDFGLFPVGLPDTTGGGAAAPGPATRLNKMGSSNLNWGGSGGPPPLPNYESSSDLKQFLNLL